VNAVAGTTAIAIAAGANLLMKSGLVASVCGIALAKPIARAFAGPLLGLVAGVGGLYLLG
jgi:hypothetical protein